jgi:phosphohistidine phosphatase
MIKRLWILRHGEAERHTQRDSERELTVRGEEDARAAGEYLAQVMSPALRIFASPYRRAQQTAQCVLLALPGKQLTTVEWLTPDEDPLAALDELEKLPDTEVLLVSHQPLVSALAGLLVDGDYRAGPAMGTASLAELELSMVTPGGARLTALRHAPDYRSSAV